MPHPHQFTKSSLAIQCCAAITSACMCLSIGLSTASADFRVGIASRIITPDPLLPISGGMGPTQAATSKRGELLARAFVIEKDGFRVAIISVDALGFPRVLGDQARSQVRGILPENILISASHTHSGPDFYAFPDGQGGHTGDLNYMKSVCKLIAEATNEAIDQLQPAKLRIATGEAQGKIAYNYYAPDLYDRRLSVIQALTPDDRTIATLVNYAVHPEVLGAGNKICSPDLIGPLRDRIEAKTGGLAMFINGAVGGMITADNRDLNRPRDAVRGYWDDDRTWDECLRIGHTLGDEALRLIELAPFQVNPKLICKARKVRFPVESDTVWAVVQLSPLKYPHSDNDRAISTIINFIELGNAKIITIPGEALPNIGFYLKRKMGGDHNLLFGLTNDAFGYILTKEDFNSFDRYKYISETSLGEQTGSILIDNALELTNRGP